MLRNVMAAGFASLFLFAGIAVAQETTPRFSGDRLEQLVAPIALYPDALLAEVLMAATYPLEVVEAARFMQAQPALAGADLESALRDQDWDASVKSLCGFPDLLARMDQDLDWLRDLGDASLAQQADLMDAVQRMRARAAKAGNLKSSQELTVTQGADDVIEIVPASVEVIYVPTYYPTAVYGDWRFASWWYPSFYVPPPFGAPFFFFGAGVPWGFGLFGSCDWGRGHGHVAVDVRARNQFVQRTFANPQRLIVAAPAGRSPWQHDSAHRHGVNYRDASAIQRFRPTEGRTPRFDPNALRGRTSPSRAGRSGDATPSTSRPRAPAPPRDARPSPPRPTAPRSAPPSAPARGGRGRVFTGVRAPALDRASIQRGRSSMQQRNTGRGQAGHGSPPGNSPKRSSKQ